MVIRQRSTRSLKSSTRSHSDTMFETDEPEGPRRCPGALSDLTFSTDSEPRKSLGGQRADIIDKWMQAPYNHESSVAKKRMKRTLTLKMNSLRRSVKDLEQGNKRLKSW